jgi:hypothetical protein
VQRHPDGHRSVRDRNRTAHPVVPLTRQTTQDLFYGFHPSRLRDGWLHCISVVSR